MSNSASSHGRSRRAGSKSWRSIPRRSSPTRCSPSMADSRARSSVRDARTKAQRRWWSSTRRCMRASGAARQPESIEQQPAEAALPGQPLDGRRREHARVVRRRRVDRAGQRDAVPARDARRGPRRGKRAVGGVDDVVAEQPRRQQRVVRRQVGVIRDVRQERQVGAAEQRRVDAVADVRAERVRRRLRAQEVHRQIQGIPRRRAAAASRSQVLT